jgi:hypothetical protein
MQSQQDIRSIHQIVSQLIVNHVTNGFRNSLPLHRCYDLRSSICRCFNFLHEYHTYARLFYHRNFFILFWPMKSTGVKLELEKDINSNSDPPSLHVYCNSTLILPVNSEIPLQLRSNSNKKSVNAGVSPNFELELPISGNRAYYTLIVGLILQHESNLCWLSCSTLYKKCQIFFSDV